MLGPSDTRPFDAAHSLWLDSIIIAYEAAQTPARRAYWRLRKRVAERKVTAFRMEGRT
jgi:hypothetical protein